MLFNTHISIGQFLHTGLSANQTSIIGKQAFVYGNIKPDIFRKGSHDRHMFSISRTFLSDALIRLTTATPLSMTRTESSVLLGVLCHHLCDMFCRYHYDLSLYPNLRGHFHYEVGLHKRFLQMINDDYSVHTHGFIPRGTEDLMQYLTMQLHAYSREKPSFDLDIHYALHNCELLMKSLVPVLMMIYEPNPLQMQETELVLWRDAI